MKKKMIKTLITFLVSIALFAILNTVDAYASTNGYTQEGAVNYARGLVGTQWDVDGTGYDCVDIVKK